MLRKTIKFQNFNDEDVQATYLFHLGKADLIRMEVEVKGGMGEYLTRIGKAKDHEAIMAVVEKLVANSYGIKSEDGMRFIKNPQILEEFKQTNAYSELIMELCTDEEALLAFISGIMPHNLQGDLAKIANRQKAIDAIQKRKDGTAENLEELYEKTLEGPASVMPDAPPPKVQRILTMAEATSLSHEELSHLLATGEAVLGNFKEQYVDPQYAEIRKEASDKG